jgi:hypothetical protein
MEFIEFLSDNALKELQLANKELVTMVANVDKVGQKMKGISTPSGSDSAIKSLTEQYKEQERVIKSLQTKIEQLTKTKQTANQRTSEEIVNQRTLAQQADRQTRATSALVGAYANLNAQHQIASKRLQDLIVRGRQATQTQAQYNKELERARIDFQQLDARIQSADRAVGRFNRNVGNYPTQALRGIKDLAIAFGLVGGVYLFAGAVKEAFKTIKEFDKANADLAATMGLNRSQISALTNDQKRLGASTKFTASEVAKLQKEFAKLGFSQKEILNATEATLALAAAVDTDLENAAMVAGSTLRGFGLDASEMGRVTDVMASSFTKSALDIENFRESMKYVAPIAKSTGTSIEFTTAMLGKLADAGIKGSQAGTSLRRILSEMANTGLPAAQALDKVARSGITVKDAMDEVGRNAQTALLVLSQSKDGIGLLADELERAGGAAQKMANEQLESLEGKLTILASAWDGFVLSLVKGDGALSKFFISAIEGLTKFLGMLTNANKSLNDFKTEVFSGAEGDVPKQLVENVEEYLNILRKRNVSEEQINEERQKKILEYAKRELNAQKILLFEAEKNALAYEDVYKKQTNSLKNILTFGQSDNEAKKRLEGNVLAIERYKGAIKGLEGLIQQTLNPTKQQTEAIEENTDKTKKNTKAKKEAEIYAVGSVKWLKQQIAQLQELNDTQSLTNEEYQVGVGAIKFYQQWLERLVGTIKEVKQESEGIQLDLGGSEFLTDEEGDEIIRQGEELRAWLKDFRKEFSDDFWANSGFSEIQKIIDNWDYLKESGTDAALAISEAFQQAFNTISSYSNANFDQMYRNLEQQRDVSILFAGESATAREEIERQYEERRRRIQRQQAEAQKRMAMFNIAVDTAQAIVATLAQTPPPAGLPLAALIGAIGAIQMTMVASQPIPAFEKGGIHDGGLMLVNDGKGSNYAEKVVTPDGKVHEPKGRNVVMNAPKGTKIFTHDQWKDQLNNILLSNGINAVQPQTQQQAPIVNVQTKDNYHFSIDEQGIRKTITRGATKTQILNARFKQQKRDV